MLFPAVMKKSAVLVGIPLVLLVLIGSYSPGVRPAEIGRLTDRELEELSLRLSEDPGYFDTDNLISNEISYTHVAGTLGQIGRSGQVYLGVGPDQNFTYMAALRPAAAFIIDIRRDNLLQQLYFKQLLEMSRDRWEYLSLLFGKRLPEGFQGASSSDAAQLVEYFRSLPSDEDFFDRRFQLLWTELRGRFPGLVKEADRSRVDGIARAFFDGNLDLRFQSHGRRPRSHYPTFEDLLLERDHTGAMRNYLNAEQDFQFLRRMQQENRVIPVVGDFAGGKALSSIGDYVKSEGYAVSAFYVSNVEFYLFQEGRFSAFLDNLSRLPLDRTSLIIRSYFNYGRRHPETWPGYYVTSLLQRAEDLLEQGKAGRVGYWDVVMDYIPMGAEVGAGTGSAP